MAENRELQMHRDWLEPLQQVGLVVSPPALQKAGAVPQKTDLVDLQDHFTAQLDDDNERIVDFARFTTEFLEWPEGRLIDDVTVIDELTVALPEFEDHLAPTWAVPDAEAEKGYFVLVKEWPFGTDLDKRTDRGWDASPQARHERLLREREIPIGLLSNGGEIRLTYAPRGETSGHLTFPVADMTTVLGRPFLAALHMLLEGDRLFAGGRIQKTGRLAAILSESRKYQNEVSNILAEQVLAALNELLRGFQAADNQKNGALLDETFRDAPQDIYGGLLTTLLRLVFVLYSEDRGLMPGDEIYTRHYSVAGLFEKLRDDAGRHPDDLMDRRYGAWARLLTLFRLIHDGGRHERINLPPRHGELFNPDRYPFLEGRSYGDTRNMGESLDPPRVSDGVIWRVLQNLLILDGERLSYRSLDVEQIGSVYEAMMGFGLERSIGHTIALRPKHIVVDLDAMLAMKPAERKKHLKDEAQCQVTGQAEAAVKKAETVVALVEALTKKISPSTPRILPTGSYFLQPGEERRRSGSHYTPRSLTEPIVRTTLRPIFEDMGANPKPEKILALKVCDPAMGSGAFLVEACRQLAEKLVDAWQKHKCLPDIPPDEDPLLHARRVIAQRCLYGVDKNPFAVSLAKLSLWLVTLAKDHAFTFLDHALKHGDSLVGLTREQIKAFTWETPKGELPLFPDLDIGVKSALKYRAAIQELKDENETEKRRRHKDAEDALFEARLAGDLIIAAFFAANKDKARKETLQKHREQFRLWKGKSIPIQQVQSLATDLREGEKPVPPFHWEIEFPEVFERENPGFDAIIGNPPFLGGKRITSVYGMIYFDWLLFTNPEAGHLCDIVARFFRRSFSLLRTGGAFGLLATNTIAQGDTRKGGLHWLKKNDGLIYDAKRRIAWPGHATVVVSVVHMTKSKKVPRRLLDERVVDEITCFLLSAGGDEDPFRLKSNEGLFSVGSFIYGQGFLFDDNDPQASPIKLMKELISKRPDYSNRIFPYIGGREINSSPTHSHQRFVIYLSDIQDERELSAWPEVSQIVREKVKPERDKLGSNPNNVPLKRRWWAYQAHRPQLYARARALAKVLVNAQTGPHLVFTFLPTGMVYSHAINVFLYSELSVLSILQSRAHEVWARLFASSLKDDLRYTPSDCFETFPFPSNWRSRLDLESVGKEYYEFRADLMIRNDEGLTKTYNRFHDPEERDPDIHKLRDLHAQMDRAVLDAYGWTDIPTECEFILDYEIDEENWSPRKKKPWRYRWPDEVRDEVLARLLELNKQRAEEERVAGLTPAARSDDEDEDDGDGASLDKPSKRPVFGDVAAKKKTKKRRGRKEI
jgi:Eco57I restriction-modification methylase/MmeI, target recognition domain